MAFIFKPVSYASRRIICETELLVKGIRRRKPPLASSQVLDSLISGFLLQMNCSIIGVLVAKDWRPSLPEEFMLIPVIMLFIKEV